MLEELKATLREMIGDAEFAQLSAQSTMIQVNALINEGFTREEAISLMVRK